MGSLKVGTEPLAEALLGLGKDLVGGGDGLDLDDLALLLVVVDDGHARLDKGAEALADALGVVVGAAAGLAALEQALLHDLFRAVKEEDELGGADRVLELVGLVELAREAVDEEAALPGALFRERVRHGVLEQLDRHLHGHNQAVFDVVADKVAKLRAGTVLLGAEEVAGGEMREAVLLDELGALGALAGARAAENEDDGDILGREDGAGDLGGAGGVGLRATGDGSGACGCRARVSQGSLEAMVKPLRSCRCLRPIERLNKVSL